MKVYVDGDSLLHHLRHQEDPIVRGAGIDGGRGNLVRWLAQYAQAQDCEVIVVFDENQPGEVLPPVERLGRVKAVNVPPGGDARKEMAGPANRSAMQERTCVVTDRPALAAAFERGPARVLTSARFMEAARTLMRGSEELRTDEPDEKFTGLSDAEVELWADLFTDEEEKA